MRNVLDRSCRENQNTHFMFSNFFSTQESCQLWDNEENAAELDRPQTTI